MSKDVEAGGGLLPLKAIQTRRTRGRHHHHRHSCSIHPGEKEPDERGSPKETSSHHHRQSSEERSTSQETKEPRRSPRQAEVSNRMSYGQFSKPQQFQAHQKAEKEVVRCGIHGEHTERELHIPFQQAQSQPALYDLRRLKKTLNLGDLDLPCQLHRQESTCSTDVGTQMGCKRLLAVSRQTSQSVAPEHHHYEECGSLAEPYPGVYEECHLHRQESTCTRVVQEAASNLSSNPSVSTSHMVRHVATQMSCKRLLAVSRQTRRDEEATSQSVVAPEHHHYEECASLPEPYPGVYEVCHLHHIEEHVIASPRTSPFACHQSVVHLQSPRSRDSTNLCERCGLPEPAQNGFSSPGSNGSSHHSRVKRCAQISTRSELHSPCILHGDCSSDPPAPEQRKRPKKGKIHDCHLHREPPASQEPPRIRWLDRIRATQHIPPQIIREFLRGRRGWPPDAMKQKCPGCIKKPTDEDDRAPRPANFASWNSVPQSAFKEQHQDEKLARLLVARTLIVAPVVKLSTSKSLWCSRRELQVCSECYNPTKFGRWAPILKKMANDDSGAADMSTCDRRFSSCTEHGNPNPKPDPNLRCPLLFSACNKRSQAQELQNETFNEKAALKAAGMMCIKLDGQVLAHVREKRSPPRSKPASPSMQRMALAHKRQELYVGLSKVVQNPRLCRTPTPVSQLESKRREVTGEPNRPKLMPKPPEIMWICPDQIHSPKSLQLQIKSKK